MTSDKPLLVNNENSIVTLTLNRPDKFNALSEQLLDALLVELQAVKADASIAVVVIAANGKAFCAGHDLKQMRQNHGTDYYGDLFETCSRMMQLITELPQPVIACVNGMATAAGCQLVATCDMAVAAEGAQFGVSGVNLGLFCSTPSVALSRVISRKRAFEMLTTGEFIDAATAADWGLINRAVPAAGLDAEITRLTDSIMAKSPVPVKMGKALFYRQLTAPIAAAYEDAGETMACNMMTHDAVEGIDAFIEKRKPVWRGE